MLVILKRVGEPPERIEIENTLEALQRAVGGYIETVTPLANAVIICNEEGRLLGLPHNCTICSFEFCGDILVCKQRGENFVSFTPEEAATITELLF